jgi:hypothetical protein
MPAIQCGIAAALSPEKPRSHGSRRIQAAINAECGAIQGLGRMRPDKPRRARIVPLKMAVVAGTLSWAYPQSQGEMTRSVPRPSLTMEDRNWTCVFPFIIVTLLRKAKVIDAHEAAHETGLLEHPVLN